MFLIVLSIIIFIVWAYVLFIMDWMFARWPDQVGWWRKMEDTLWAQSKTILTARLYWIGGVIVFLHDLAAQAGIDVTPITNELSNFIPEKYRPLALAGFLMVTGIMFEYLRRITSTPVGESDK